MKYIILYFCFQVEQLQNRMEKEREQLEHNMEQEVQRKTELELEQVRSKWSKTASDYHYHLVCSTAIVITIIIPMVQCMQYLFPSYSLKCLFVAQELTAERLSVIEEDKARLERELVEESKRQQCQVTELQVRQQC